MVVVGESGEGGDDSVNRTCTSPRPLGDPREILWKCGGLRSEEWRQAVRYCLQTPKCGVKQRDAPDGLCYINDHRLGTPSRGCGDSVG